ncbi:MAG: class I SAM-dependent RNA methyltransferase, partial [Mycobacteriaceae bacterium]|nr:class I SAM-dependent RNA methyltransferase [Mycobacteriaceae bacterium]
AAAGARATRVVEGTGRAAERVAGRRFELDAAGFWQPHRDAAQRYSDLIAQWAAAAPGATAVDLYSGVGVFAARLGEQVGRTGSVLGVESSTAAVADGAAALADMPQVELRAARVEKTLAALSDRPDVVVLDPPRAGAGRAVTDAVTAGGAGVIVHVGCDPAAFARDVGLYAARGYRLAEVRAFDAFPLTHHVECLGLLIRPDRVR